MASLFTRDPIASRWDPSELAGPYEPLTLREWQISIAIYRLHPALGKLLRAELGKPATPACRKLVPCPPHRCLPFEPRALASALLVGRREQLQHTLAALWQLLEAPPTIPTGLARDLALVGLAIRLRQLLNTFSRTSGSLNPTGELRQALAALGFQLEPETSYLDRFRRPRPPWWRRWAGG